MQNAPRGAMNCTLQYFWPSLSYHLSLRFLFCLFLSGPFTQVFLCWSVSVYFTAYFHMNWLIYFATFLPLWVCFLLFSAHWFLAIICYPGLTDIHENPFIPKPHTAPPPPESAIPTPPQPRDDEEDIDMEEMDSEVTRNIFLKKRCTTKWKKTCLLLVTWEIKRKQSTFNIQVSEYDQEIPQSQTADKPMAPRAALPSQTRWLQNQNGHKVSHNKTQNNYRIQQREQPNFLLFVVTSVKTMVVCYLNSLSCNL